MSAFARCFDCRLRPHRLTKLLSLLVVAIPFLSVTPRTEAQPEHQFARHSRERDVFLAGFLHRDAYCH